MAKTVFEPDLAGAADCKFCGGDFLLFVEGAVSCDMCQSEGPFHMGWASDPDWKIEAVRLLNLTPEDDWGDED